MSDSSCSTGATTSSTMEFRVGDNLFLGTVLVRILVKVAVLVVVLEVLIVMSVVVVPFLRAAP